MKKLSAFFLLCMVAGLWCFKATAQDKSVPFEAASFTDTTGLGAALQALAEGDRIYDIGDKALWQLALPHYQTAQEFNPNNDALNFKLGMCYLYSIYRAEALPHFEKSYELNPVIDPDIHYCLGRGYHLKEQWDKAIYEYELYSRNLSGQEDMKRLIEVSKLKNECRNGEKFSGSPERVWIDNMGPEINSQYAEYSPLVTADESSLLFTSRRPSTTGGGLDETDHKPYEDIYFTYQDSGKWVTAFNLGKPLNSEDHDATAGMSADGKTLYVYKGKRKGGDLMVTTMESGAYLKPIALPKDINTDFKESSACMSYDGKKLYFVSEKPGGVGGSDIYVCDWLEKKGKWGEAMNIGTTINTKYDEESVFMHPDGVTMYFSSKGHSSMGGFDIFYSKLVEGKWTRPKNLGWPINSADDDVFFVVGGSGRHGYYASIKEGGYGEKDLYKITFLGPSKEPLLNNEDNLLASASLSATVSEKVIEPKVEVRSNLAILRGIVLDKETGEPVKARVELVDNETGEVISTATSDAKTGKYLVSLPAGRNYGVAVTIDGYLFHSENFIIPDSSGYREYPLDIDLPKVAVGNSIVLKNIFYDFDKATLRKESIVELNRLVALMKDNGSMAIEISGHTDNKGAEGYNQTLSEKRANAVVEYLTERGIKLKRLNARGYGETMPVATNDTEEGRQLNRRTEFKIISID